LPRKTFVSNEILTASDVNSFLMDQAVMVFADSAARGSAIPTPVEGMVTYLSDVNQVQAYDGAAFKPVGGLVAVKTVAKTDTFSASLTGGANTTVTDLSITHEIANSGNKLFLTAQIGVNGSDIGSLNTGVGFFFAEGATALNLGDAASSRTRVSSGVGSGQYFVGAAGLPQHLSLLHTPTAGSKTYTVNIVNVSSTTGNVYVNRTGSDGDDALRPRGASTFTLMEVAG
jgi:hypothetical protein